MSEKNQSNEPTQEQPSDARPGYLAVVTGSSKHPDAANAENGTVEATIGVFVGSTIAEAVEKYGEEFVMNNYIRSVVVAVQGKVRRELDKGTPVSTVEAEFDDLDPTEQRTVTADPQTQAMRALAKMSDEQKAAFLAMFNNQ